MSHILFVISCNFDKEIIGGHLLSAITLAQHLRQTGHTVGLAASLGNIPPELHQADITFHQVPYPGVLSRPAAIWRLMRQHRYEAVISMDVVAAWQVALPVIQTGAALVQIIPGGPVPRFPVIHLPGIVVFSRELYEGIPPMHKLPQEYLVQSAGRVDFSFFESGTDEAEPHDLGFVEEMPRVMAISRLHLGKHKALEVLFDEIRDAAQSKNVQLVVIGEGGGRPALEKKASEIMQQSEGRARIHFAGGFRITPSDLKQADLVVGQGRTVVEALASGVPAAVCGNQGYFGLLTPETLPTLVETNLTGRGIAWRGSLLADLEQLESYTSNKLDEVRKAAFNLYDVSQGATTIERTITDLLKTFSTCSVRRRANVRGYLRTGMRLICWGAEKAFRELHCFHRRANHGI